MERSNQFPIDQECLDYVRDQLGDTAVRQVVEMQLYYARTGGVNPNAVKYVFNPTSKGPLDVSALMKVVTSFNNWGWGSQFND